MSAARTAEVVIAGAGIAGIAAAYQLAVRAGVTRVVVVDPREPLSLTTSRGAEAYRNYWPGPDDTMACFMDRSIDLLDALDHESGHAFELNRRGYVFLTADPAEANRLRTTAGPTTEFVAGAADIRARYPFVTDRVVAMLHARRAGYMNALALGRWLLQRTLRQGVDLVRDEVIGLGVENHRFTGVRLASGSRIDARLLVMAAGPRLPEWAERLELAVPIVNERHGKISFEDEAVVVPRDAPLLIWNDPVELPGLGTFPAGVHLRPRGERSVLGIWTYETSVEEPRVAPVFPPEYADVVLGGLAVMIPGLRTYCGRSAVATVDGGYYCKTPDNRPLIGPTAIAGIYLLGALSGFGIMASQAAAELVAAHMLEKPLAVYAAAFHPARFDDPSYRRGLATANARRGQL
jgi:glycine/D-amino acid oxidase-like deaminating enzyme